MKNCVTVWMLLFLILGIESLVSYMEPEPKRKPLECRSVGSVSVCGYSGLEYAK